MQDYWQTVIGRQFAAAIQMLRSAVEACPDDLWDDYAHGTPFWHLAYHALFYADFYLSDDAETIPSKRFPRRQSQLSARRLSAIRWGRHHAGKAFTRVQLLEYADHCLRKSDETF